MIKRGIYPLIQVKQTHLIGSRQNGNYPDPISLRFREEMTREGLTVRNLGGTLDKWVSHAADSGTLPRVGLVENATVSSFNLSSASPDPS